MLWAQRALRAHVAASAQRLQTLSAHAPRLVMRPALRAAAAAAAPVRYAEAPPMGMQQLVW